MDQCECHELICRDCQETYTAVDFKCSDEFCLFNGCYYCQHVRNFCQRDMVIEEMLQEAKAQWAQQSGVSWAQCYYTAISSVFNRDSMEAPYWPVVGHMLDESEHADRILPGARWVFEDKSALDTFEYRIRWMRVTTEEDL